MNLVPRGVVSFWEIRDQRRGDEGAPGDPTFLLFALFCAVYDEPQGRKDDQKQMLHKKIFQFWFFSRRR